MSNVTNIVDYKTIDLGSIFSGQEYPKRTFPVYLHHQIGYLVNEAAISVRDAETALTIAQSSDEVDDITPFAKAVEEARAGFDEAVAAVKAQEFTVTVQAKPRAERKDIWDKANDLHKPESDILGREKTNPKASENFTEASWALHIVDFVAPDGVTRVKFDTPHDAAYFRGNAPDQALNRIEDEINALYDNETAGFEAAAQEIGFLSGASPEA